MKKEELPDAIVCVVTHAGGKKFSTIPVSLNWKVEHLKISHPLKKFLEKNGIKTLGQFNKQFSELRTLPKIDRQLCDLKRTLDHFIAGPPYKKEMVVKLKKYLKGYHRRTTQAQRAFLYGLHLLRSILKRTREFKAYIQQIAQELKITWVKKNKQFASLGLA